MKISPVVSYGLSQSVKSGTQNVQNSISNFAAPAFGLTGLKADFLSQMPNVNFGSNFGYGNDDEDGKKVYVGKHASTPLEGYKYQITVDVADYIKNEDYLSAIKGKIKLAQINKSQGNERDAYLLEHGVRRLYKDLPKYQREEAKDVIAGYNPDMAKYIDEDIKNI